MDIDISKLNIEENTELNKYNIYYDKMLINPPESLAIILDGNGRYAKKNNLQVSLGHKAGCETLEIILEEVVKLGIKFFTVYAFSTENWKRERTEIDALFDLFFLYLSKIEKKAIKNNVKVLFIGDIYQFPERLYKECERLMNVTSNNDRCTFSIAFNYGSRDEIVRAIKKMSSNGYNFDNLTEKDFSNYLDTKNIKDPDLLIRTSGELRLSNFLLWQIAYSELYFSDKLWPEFSANDLYIAIISYSFRKRRFGGR